MLVMFTNYEMLKITSFLGPLSVMGPSVYVGDMGFIHPLHYSYRFSF